MAINSCDICGCIPPYMKDDFFYQAAINLLCLIQENTAAEVLLGNVNIAEFGGTPVSIGRQLSSASIPVTLSSDEVIKLNNAGNIIGVPAGLVGFMPISTGPSTATGGSTTTITGAGFSSTWINHIVFFRSGTADNVRAWAYISAATSTLLTLDRSLPAAVANNDTFYVMIPTPLSVLNNSTSGTPPALVTAIDSLYQNSPATGLLKLEDSAHASGDAGVAVWGVIQATPSSSAGDGDYGAFKLNSLGYQYVDPIYRASVTATQPSINTATSTTLVASNTSRRYLEIQNNSAANIMISLTGATLTGIVPSGTNLGLVLTAGEKWRNPSHFCPTSAITVYQTSGGTITTVSVQEG